MENRHSNSWAWWLSPLIVLLVLAADQWLKYWVKTSMYLGQEIPLIGDWCILHFTENNGMAFGMEAGGKTGKYFLTFFRIVAVVGIIWYLVTMVRRNAHKGLLLCITFVLAGAIGNIIDSVFYGVWFADINYYESAYFLGRVVDMFYLPVIHSTWPAWMPWFGGQEFIFFRPVFNIADASISTGIISILVFQKRFFAERQENSEESDSEETASENTEEPS